MRDRIPELIRATGGEPGLEEVAGAVRALVASADTLTVAVVPLRLTLAWGRLTG